MIAVRSISFENRQGQRLNGILHEPVSRSALGICILLLSPGVKGRVGPHRLYRKIAERLAPLGFHVLRFDFHGLGDSEGELADASLVQVYNAVQAGRYVGDTIDAMDWMQGAFGISRFVGSGLCGGSLTALLTAADDSRIECILGLGIPVTLDGGRENWGQHLTRGQMAEVRRGYLGKLTDAKSWGRLLRGKSDYSVIWKSLRHSVSPRSRQMPAIPPSQAVAEDNTNPRFAPAFRSVTESGRRILLIFGANDRLQFEFAEKFEARNSAWVETHRATFQMHVIPDANHVLSDGPWVSKMLDAAASWLAETLPQ